MIHFPLKRPLLTTSGKWPHELLSEIHLRFLWHDTLKHIGTTDTRLPACHKSLYLMLQKTQPIRTQQRSCMFVGCPPHLPILHWAHAASLGCMGVCIFYDLDKIAEGSCGHQENKIGTWDILFIARVRQKETQYRQQATLRLTFSVTSKGTWHALSESTSRGTRTRGSDAKTYRCRKACKWYLQDRTVREVSWIIYIPIVTAM